MKNSVYEKCPICKKPVRTLRSVIYQGKFHKLCWNCYDDMKQRPSAEANGYKKERMREDHAKDIVQRYDAKGEIAEEFVRAYPEKAQEYFSSDELSKF